MTRQVPIALHIALLLTLSTAAGCGASSAFSSRFPSNDTDDIAEMLARLGKAPSVTAAPIAIGLTSEPRKLFAYHLASHKVLWQAPLAATSEPWLAGNLAIVQAGDEVLGFGLQDGRRVFSTDVGDMRLSSASGEGDTAVFALTRGAGSHADAELVLLRHGAIAWRRPLEYQIGVPAVVGDVVLVPWGSQFLSAIDVKSGTEFARALAHDGVIAHAFRSEGDVFVGSFHGVTRVSASIGSTTLKGSSFYSLPDVQLPGRTQLLRDIYRADALRTPDSAQHRLGLTWQPTTVDGIRTAARDDNLYLFFYRFVFALDPKTLDTRWVYVHDNDLVGATAQAGAVAVADEKGSFGLLGARSGKYIAQGRGLAATVVKLPHDGGGSPGEPPSEAARIAGLIAAAQDMDARLVPARLFAVDALARADDAEATSGLLGLCDDRRMAPALRKGACDALQRRTLGADHLLQALERHAAFLQGTTPPPVGALARAAAKLGEKRAVGPLISHLKDPHTPSEDLPALVIALRDLGDPAAAEPLSAFLLMYHADPVDEQLVRALELIPEALVQLVGPAATEALELATSDALGAFGVRERARIALNALQQTARVAQQKEIAEQEEQKKEASEPKEKKPEVPEHLTTELVTETLRPVEEQLKGCLKAAGPSVFNARLVLVVEQGKVLMASVVPKDLQACVEPLVRAQKFPSTKSGRREQISHTLKRF